MGPIITVILWIVAIALLILSAVIALALITFLVYVFILVKPPKKIKPAPSLIRDYAHRGLHGNGVPENSLAAFELACQRGDGIELDVQLSRDGVVMVFHDYTLIRMTGVDKKLCELDAAELTEISLAGTDQKIPTFADVLALVNGRVPLLVELKGESFDVSLCKKVADMLLEYNGEYCIESFNPLLIKEIKKYLPDAFRGQLFTNVCRDKGKITLLNVAISLMAFNFLSKPDFIAYNQADRDSMPVNLTTKFYRAPSFVWTTRGKTEIDKAHKLGEHPIYELSDK